MDRMRKKILSILISCYFSPHFVYGTIFVTDKDLKLY